MLPGVDSLTARSSFLPDLIKGDLDSVRPDVQDFYTSRCVLWVGGLSQQQVCVESMRVCLQQQVRLENMKCVFTSASMCWKAGGCVWGVGGVRRGEEWGVWWGWGVICRRRPCLG
jgi:hypothetical protein